MKQATPLRPWIVAALTGVFHVANAGADVLDDHPNAAELKVIFAAPAAADFRPTGVTRADYLKLIAGNVDRFKSCQNASGAIIDPVSNGERQYSTPAFAIAAGLLVKEVGRADLLDPACRAMTHALDALVAKKTADGHSDFYIPLLVHAYRLLKDAAPAGQAAHWKNQFAKVNPETMYNARLRGMNWNVVSSSGELLRRHDGLVAPDMMAAQMKYLDACLKVHVEALSPLGLFKDPGVPMAYDAFSRLWLEDVFADNAYDGVQAAVYEKALRTGGLSTLLMLSPAGEWPTGGRSGMHNWTDAQVLAVCEMNAVYWKAKGRDDIAGAFKRAAHLAYRAIAHWQRPTGELNIIKNRAAPEARFAYEGYSNHSQYNLLPMAMLAIAYVRADESIAEKPSPSEVGGYVFDAREGFHKLFAAAGGYYVEIDTAADGHYNATGLQRVHRAGVPFSALSDTVAPERAYGPKDAPKAAVALGLEWQATAGGPWIALGDFLGGKAKRTVTKADVRIESATPGRAAFAVGYALGGGDGGREVTEQYTITADGVTQTSSASGNPAGLRVQWPVLVNDGATDTKQVVAEDGITVTHDTSVTRVTFAAGQMNGRPVLDGRRLIHHNGYVRAAAVTAAGPTVTVTVRLTTVD